MKTGLSSLKEEGFARQVCTSPWEPGSPCSISTISDCTDYTTESEVDELKDIRLHESAQTWGDTLTSVLAHPQAL